MNDLASRLLEAVRRGRLEATLEELAQLFLGLAGNLDLAGTAFPFPVYDEICTEIGRKSAFELLAPQQQAIKEDHDIVILTEATVQGGHVELIRDIADASERKIVIVATNLYNGRKDVVLPALAKHKRVLDVIALEQSDLLTKLRTVQSLIANPAAGRIIVMCHAHDVVAISAVAPVANKTVLFFHHCDHTPCLGCYLPHAEHIDLHNMAFDTCRRELGLNPGYICMTSRGDNIRQQDSLYAKPMFKSITCGGEHKLVNFGYPIEYADVVVELIRQRKGTHFHVGPLRDSFIDKIHHALDAAELPRDAFIHVGHVSGFREIIGALEIDLYVPTLPQAGGKALIDAMSAGLPVLVHENAIDRLWGGRDLVYPQAPRWNDLATLRPAIQRFDDEVYWREQVKASRAYFEQNHAWALFKQMLDGNGRLEGHCPPPLKAYRPSHQVRLSAAALAAGN